MATPTSPEFGLAFPVDQTSVVCLAFGIGIVALVAMKKFEESTIEKGEDDFIAQLLPKYLATREQYSRALIRYVGSMIAILCALCFVGPRLLEILAPDLKSYAPVAPLGFALLVVGFLPNVPWLQDVEWRVRRFWHERAFIPEAARATADGLRAANFDFSLYMQPPVLACPGMRGVELADFQAPRGTIEYGWARLSCLSHELARRRDAGETESLDDEMLDRYARDLDNVASKRRAMEVDMAQYREQKIRSQFYENDRLRNEIKNALWQLYILLGCAARLKLSRSGDINAAFRTFGFVLGPSTPPPKNHDLMIVGLTVMSASLLMLAFASVAAGVLFEENGMWNRSDYFPKDARDPLLWSLSAALTHGVAILSADWMRGRLLRNGQWFVAIGRERQPVAANYIRVAFGCAVFGYIALFLWGLTVQPLTLGFAISTIPFALLPAATGAFYGYHLDNVELDQRPSRPWEIGLQSFVTGCCGLVVAPIWLSLGGSTVADNLDYILLVAVFGSVVGASLAWYLPKAAAERRRRELQILAETTVAPQRSETVLSALASCPVTISREAAPV